MKGVRLMQKIDVSIIVPVYNLEKYILKCLESLVGQTYKSYEVIIVDDGSVDGSAKIITDFIFNNSLENFIFLQTVNRGPSAARNEALKIAKGKWISFVDGDDWVEQNYLEIMVSKVEETGADLCIGGLQAFYEADKRFDVWVDHGNGFYEMPRDLNKLYSYGYLHAHLYKKAIIDKYNIYFDEDMRIAEDSAYNLDYNSKISSFCTVKDVIHNYRIGRSGSITQKTVHPKMKKNLCFHMKGFTDSFNEDDLIKCIYENHRLARVMWNELYASITNAILEKQYKDAKKRIKLPITKAVLKAYKPRSKKEKLMRFLLIRSFFVLRIITKVYYGNYERLRKTKLLNMMSRYK